MTDAPSTTHPACPPWCSWPAGHPYTDAAKDGSYVARYHDAPTVAGVLPEHKPMAAGT